jgi:hypothetical protein
MDGTEIIPGFSFSCGGAWRGVAALHRGQEGRSAAGVINQVKFILCRVANRRLRFSVSWTNGFLILQHGNLGTHGTPARFLVVLGADASPFPAFGALVLHVYKPRSGWQLERELQLQLHPRAC